MYMSAVWTLVSVISYNTTQLVKDVGTMLEGPEAVKEGLIDEVGGMKEALGKLYDLIGKEKSKSPEK